jgi:rfaE bifunctional protein kinase chain/domain
MNTQEILKKFHGLSVLVVGDICLDRWCRYDPDLASPSRETGLVRIAVTKTEGTPGAGGTVANNLVALGAGRAAVLGCLGADGFGWELRQALRKRGIETGLLIEAHELQTFTYTKLINRETEQEDLPRVDFVNSRSLPERVEAAILQRLEESVPKFDVVMVSDQAETEEGGTVTPAVREALSDLAAQSPKKVFWVDSRLRPEQFRNVIVKPNREEADDACQRLFGRVDYGALRRHIEGRALLVTAGEEGVLVVEENGERWVRTRAVAAPVDICGAGDSFSAGAALTLAVTGSLEEAARVGNLAAAASIMKKGTGTASPVEVLEAEATS